MKNDHITSSKFTLKNREQLFLYFLGIILFFITVVTNDSYIYNAQIVYIFEIVFLFLYVFLIREYLPIRNAIKDNPIISAIFFIWLISISYSLYDSPLQLINERLAIFRYFQTIVHLMTFIFIWCFFNRYTNDLYRLLLIIPISTMFVICAFIIDYLTFPSDIDINTLGNIWLNKPPFNSNIRHTGYQVAAAISIFIVFCIQKNERTLLNLIKGITLTILWAFLFWLGGRGAIASTAITVILISIVLYYRSYPLRHFTIIISITAISGLFIAEWLAVFHWNGLINSIQQSLEADSYNSLSSNRLQIWKTAWESVNGHLFFGLGPQGYYFSPNRLSNVQPHNIFLQFVLEWGLVGTILFLTLLVKAFWAGLKLNIFNNSKDLCQIQLAAGSIISTLTLHSLLDGTYYHPQPTLYLVIAFAVWLAPVNRNLSIYTTNRKTIV